MSQDDTRGGGDRWNEAEDDGVLDATDTLDDDRVQDPLDTGVVAPEKWTGANRYGTTLAEERAGESLDQLLAQEEPDIDPYAEAQRDAEAGRDEDELTRRGYETEERAGRLVAEDEGLGGDEEPDEVARDVGIDSGAASAEEAAVHIVDDPNDTGERLD